MLDRRFYPLYAVAGVGIVAVAALIWYITGSSLAFLYITIAVVIVGLFVGGIPLPVEGEREPNEAQVKEMEIRRWLAFGGKNITQGRPPGAMRLLVPCLLLAGPSAVALGALILRAWLR